MTPSTGSLLVVFSAVGVKLWAHGLVVPVVVVKFPVPVGIEVNVCPVTGST